MIDLKKLEAKFDTLFEEETEETFNAWLQYKIQRETIAMLGKGEVKPMLTNYQTMREALLSIPMEFPIDETISSGNNQYAMAA
jgi:hypothetical protein